MTLAENVADTYPDRSAADAQHQADHDVIHAAVNAVDGAYATAQAAGYGGTKRDWLEQFPVLVRKTADETVNNSAAWNVDDALTVPIAASAVMVAKFWVLYDSSTVADFRIRISGPAGASGVVAIDGPTSTTGIKRTQVALGGTVFIDGYGVGTVNLARIEGVITNGATAGNVTLDWGQAAAEATNTTVKAGSHVEYRLL